MSFDVVYEALPSGNIVGGNRFCRTYVDQNDFKNNYLAKKGNYRFIGDPATREEVEMLICEAPDICQALAPLECLFDQSGKLLDPTDMIAVQTIHLQITKSVFAIKLNHEYQEKYGIFPTDALPQSLMELPKDIHNSDITDHTRLLMILMDLTVAGELEEIKTDDVVSKFFDKMIDNFHY